MTLGCSNEQADQSCPYGAQCSGQNRPQAYIDHANGLAAYEEKRSKERYLETEEVGWGLYFIKCRGRQIIMILLFLYLNLAFPTSPTTAQPHLTFHEDINILNVSFLSHKKSGGR